MKKKKVLTLIIIALGIVMIAIGTYFICMADGDHCGYNGGLSRASTSIQFGADFYTTSAQYTGLAANAVSDLYQLTSTLAGIFFVFVGVMDICITLILTSQNKDVKNKETNTPEPNDQEEIDERI